MIDETAAKKLQEIAKHYRGEVHEPIKDNWKQKDDGALWNAVLVQIAVAGKAAGGETLASKLREKHYWYKSLIELDPDERAKEIHRQLRAAGVRYAASDIGKCNKTKAAAYNFELLAEYGGPVRYFQKIAEIPEEDWRIAIVNDELAYVKNKGARDLLIGLGIINNAIAFDIRIINILEHVGASVPPDVPTNKLKYKKCEREIIAKVCKPCGMSGAHLDRILFAKYAEIVGHRSG